MIAKITRGSSFGDILKYATQEGKSPRFVSSGNVFSSDVSDMVQEFNGPTKEYKRLKERSITKPCWQCSLSLHPDENLTDEQWNTIVKAFLLNMGFDDTYKYVAIKHHDTDHEHVHIIVNRISIDGSKVWHGKGDAWLANSVCANLESGFNLHVTNHSKTGLLASTSKDIAMKKLTTNEVEKAIRTEEKPARLVLAELITEAKSNRPTVQQFVERLNLADVEVSANVATTGRMNGFSFSYQGLAFKGSDVGAKWKELQQEIDYEQERDYLFLANIRAGARAFGVDSANREIANDNDRFGDITPSSGGQLGLPTGDGNGDFEGDEPPPNQPGRGKQRAGQQADRSHTEGSKHGTSRPATSNLADPKSDGAGTQNVRDSHQMDEARRRADAGRNEGKEPKNIPSFFDYFGRVSAVDVDDNLLHVVGKFCDERAKSDYFAANAGGIVNARFVDTNAQIYAKQKEVKEKAILNMLNALGISDYEISYIKAGRNGQPDGKKIPFQAGLSNLTALAGYNVSGHNIYIRPDYSKHSDLILIDDVNPDMLSKIYANDIPCVTVETSPENYQVWFRYSRPLDDEERTNLSRYLTKELGGDIGAIGNDRIGRLPAFTNQKEKHRKNGRFPWIGVDVSRAGRLPLVAEFEAKMKEMKRQQVVDISSMIPKPKSRGCMLESRRYDSLFNKEYQKCQDDSRADFHATLVMLKDNVSTDVLIEIIAERRQDKRSPLGYATRTVEKVQLEIANRNAQAKREHDNEKMDHSGNCGPSL